MPEITPTVNAGSPKPLLSHRIWASTLGLLLLANVLWPDNLNPWMLPVSVLTVFWLAGIWILFKPRGEGIYLPRFLTPLGLFFLFTTFSFLYSSSPLNCFREYFFLLGAFLAMLFASQVLHARDSQETFFFYLGLCLFTVSLYGLAQHYFFLPALDREIQAKIQSDPSLREFEVYAHSGRAYSFFIYPNALASFLILCLPSWFVWQWEKSLIHKLIGLVVLVPGLACLVFTYSVGAWFSLLAALLFVTLIEGKSRFLKGGVAVLFIAAILAYVISTRGWESWKNAAVSLRLENWKCILTLVPETPAWGKGLGSFAREYLRVKSFQATDMQYAHNSILHWIAETGITGALLCVWFYVAWFHVAKDRLDNGRLTDPQKALFVSLIAFWIHSLMDINAQLWETSLPAWVLMGVFTADAAAPRLSSQAPHLLRKFLVTAAMLAAAPLLAVPALGFYFEQQGLELAHAGRYDAALKATQYALKANPFEVKFHDHLAAVYANLWLRDQKKESLDQAVGEAEWAAGHDPENAYYHSHLGQLWLAEGKPDRAYDEFHEALQLDPTHPERWTEAAAAALKTALVQKINDLTDEAATLCAKSQNAAPLLAIGDGLSQGGAKDLAISVWQRAGQILPADPEVLKRLDKRN